jgi:UDP-N-acetylmuramate--alanine ligase
MKSTHFPYKHVHLVGIKGVAMSSLAVLLTEAGVTVTGSDIADDFPTKEELDRAKIRVFVGFDAAHVTGKSAPDAVYYTGAHNGRDNVEVVAAKTAGIPVFPHGQALGTIMEGSRQIVVAGSHGKTTTSAMVSVLLAHAGSDPSWAIGCGSITGLGAAGRYGKGSLFIAEGDEYVTDPGHDQTPRFMWLTPEILVVTNIDFDHPDAYADLTAVQTAFMNLKKKSITVVCNADDANSRVLVSGDNVVTFGFSPNAEYRITHVGVGNGRMFFTLTERGVSLGEFSLKVPGRHNVLNAVAAMVASHLSGVSWDVLKEGITRFSGTKRRFELLDGSTDTLRFYDDYAHHPAEIAATLKAARSWYPESQIIAVFQPHTYSRTKTLLTQFGTCFSDADAVILTDIYASAREHDTLGMNGMTLVNELSLHHKNVHFGKDKDAVIPILTTMHGRDTVVIFMGAGDIYNWEHEVIREVTV